MAMPVIGTIHNAGKLAALELKWQQKKKNGGLNPDIDPQIKQFQEDLKRMEEGKKLSDIMVKLKSGGTLTSDELDYLKKKNPQVYQDAIAIERERESYQRQLKNCKSKEEAETLKINKMNGALAEAKSIVNNPRIPEGEKVKHMDRILARVMGIQAEHIAFVKSAFYAKLPDKEEDRYDKKEGGKSAQTVQLPDGEEEELPIVPDDSDTSEDMSLEEPEANEPSAATSAYKKLKKVCQN